MKSFFFSDTKASITKAKTDTKTAEMKLKHSKEMLKKKEQEMKRTASEFTRDKALLDRMEKEVQNLEVGRRDFRTLSVPSPLPHLPLPSTLSSLTHSEHQL